jgi:CheY-like chemotaxis protein
MPMKFVILEDNEDRRAAMRECLEDRFPQYPIRFFATAAETIRFLRLHLDETLVVSLDHDLDLISGAPGRMFDPGTGRDVADYLATQPPVCPVVIQTTNVPAGDGMERVLQEAGWTTTRVTPYGDLEWVAEVWFRLMRNAAVQTAVPASNGTTGTSAR